MAKNPFNNADQAWQISSALAGFAPTFGYMNPGQMATSAYLQDSAQGALTANAIKKANKDSKKGGGITGALTGAAKGALTGFATGGPVGAGLGAAAGGVGGYMTPQSTGQQIAGLADAGMQAYGAKSTAPVPTAAPMAADPIAPPASTAPGNNFALPGILTAASLAAMFAGNQGKGMIRPPSTTSDRYGSPMSTAMAEKSYGGTTPEQIRDMNAMQQYNFAEGAARTGAELSGRQVAAISPFIREDMQKKGYTLPETTGQKFMGALAPALAGAGSAYLVANRNGGYTLY